MTEHTPGPWTAQGTVVVAIGADVVIHIPALASVIPSRTERANAQLIAAAPTMRDALRECAEFLDDRADVLDGEDGTPRPDAFMSLLQVVQAAIAKAEGKAHD